MPGEKEGKTEKRWKGKRKANGRATIKILTEVVQISKQLFVSFPFL